MKAQVLIIMKGDTPSSFSGFFLDQIMPLGRNDMQ